MEVDLSTVRNKAPDGEIPVAPASCGVAITELLKAKTRKNEHSVSSTPECLNVTDVPPGHLYTLIARRLYVGTGVRRMECEINDSLSVSRVGNIYKSPTRHHDTVDARLKQCEREETTHSTDVSRSRRCGVLFLCLLTP